MSAPTRTQSPALRALTVQIVALAFIVLMQRIGVLSGLPLLALAALQGAIAAALAAALRAASWWLPIHLFFMPAIVLGAGLRLPNWVWASGAALLFLFYWTVFRTRVPLFLSNRQTVATLAEALPVGALRVLDIGSGTGSFVRHFARLRPESRVAGIEAAPGPAWIARWLARDQSNASLDRGDFFAADWAEFDVVYAFLSPAPMQAVWDKARAEMRPGSVLVSNSFAIPGVETDGVLEIEDRRKTRLYCYTIPADISPQGPRAPRIWPNRRPERKLRG
jgi:SAM-dependent methyltransferase